MRTEGVQILHAENDDEVRFDNLIVDGYDKNIKTIYQYHIYIYVYIYIYIMFKPWLLPLT